MLKEPQIYEEFQFFCFHRQLFIFVLVPNKTLCVSILYYSIISKQKEHIQRASNPKDVHDGH